MPWTPPATSGEAPLRARSAEGAWQVAIEEIAQTHGLWPCALEPYERGETIVWRAGQHVIKMTIPECSYQVEAEVGCLTALEGKLSVTTPHLFAHGTLAGWPYVVMERIQGVPLAEVWDDLDHEERLRLARDLGRLCRELHSLPLDGFPAGWGTFWTESRPTSARGTGRTGIRRRWCWPSIHFSRRWDHSMTRCWFRCTPSSSISTFTCRGEADASSYQG